MDGSQFDRMTRDLASGLSRRAIVKRALGGLAVSLGIGIPGAGLLRGGGSEAAGRCRHGGEVCLGDQNCCSHVCLPADQTGRRRCACEPDTTPCGTGCCVGTERCVAGVCRQPTPTATNTPTDTPTNTPTNTPTDTPTSTPTDTPTATPTCTPASCTSLNAECGAIDDGCGGTLDCGTCTGGACQANACVCPAGTHFCDGACRACCVDADCDDGNLCTTDTCDPTTHACVHTAVTCPAGPHKGNPCYTTICSPDIGCHDVQVPDGTNMPACDTLGFTTAVEFCYGGNCCTAGEGNYACFSDFACCPGYRCVCDTWPDGSLNCGNNSGQCLLCKHAGASCGHAQECCSDVCTGGFCVGE